MKRTLYTLSLLATVELIAPAAAAQPDAPPSAPPASATESVAAPLLKTRVEAPYPDAARAAQREADVGLELVVESDGTVADVKVTATAGDGFDEAAVAAARKFTFEPARKNGAPVRAIVALTYAFRLPARAPEPTPPATTASAAPAPPAADVAQQGADQATLVVARRTPSAASAFTVKDRDFRLRPVASVRDILRVTPGLVMVQHSGGGKATQYFLRGFDVDHGTDLALSLDGVPINMVSHGHGQGYADTSFIIPEIVERVDVTKGPYLASQGDFATAGSVALASRDAFEHASVGFGVTGSPGHGVPSYRALVVGSPRLSDATRATFAADVARENGPFDMADRWDRYRVFGKVTTSAGSAATLQVSAASYASTWRGSGQLPARAVESGAVGRFGTLTPTEGGYSSRHQLSAQYTFRPSDRSELKALAYVAAYGFNLFSNFTLYARDAENGDEIEQVDRRVFYGGRVSQRLVHDVAGARFETTIGAEARSDDVAGELWNTRARTRLAQVRGSAVQQTSLGAFVQEEITPAPWLRATVGGRADLLAFAVADRSPTSATPAGSGVGSAHQLSPKLGVVVSPLRERPAEVDLFVNYGHGFHSNDVRGVFAAPAVTPLTRAIGAEAGVRARLFERWDVVAAAWTLGLDNETVWIGDEGTTEVAGATRRRGIELGTRYAITDWLSADADVTISRASYVDGSDANGLALAPKRTWAGGLSARRALGPGVARAAVRMYGVGDRPASDDGALVARGFTLVDAHVGYQLRRFDLGIDVENLFDTRARAAQFATTGRLATEPATGGSVPSGFSCGSSGRVATGASGGFAGCEDIHFTPQLPFTLRAMATVYLD